MGVPKFFRYMSERYPCLSELLRENQVGLAGSVLMCGVEGCSAQ